MKPSILSEIKRDFCYCSELIPARIPFQEIRLEMNAERFKDFTVFSDLLEILNAMRVHLLFSLIFFWINFFFLSLFFHGISKQICTCSVVIMSQHRKIILK